uniref:Acetyl-coenzyme A synthetase n=1 Tax=Chromera velia CCMP2878 TaxID=1169474 RepID=A0A0G4I892_9ALVE|eukprot:Cvel_1982.t1-p1 / transcript=Cvel_1982.t1 / gene=Cvel_1982 / organism=Chromera_velia_CCMP2878 / gene_product=Acetyl-coenzyme A synthetase, putative / transcript_product=Acetyl-coenzyme A synthetase, putative / location=Cvel_scaffold75:81090-84852(+) / protein_length=697 / sequence_SO=supercontig / SO=protein_coding / is_pseudo=false
MPELPHRLDIKKKTLDEVKERHPEASPTRAEITANQDKTEEFEKHLPVDEIYDVPMQNADCHINSMAQYEKMYKESLEDPDAFWGRLAKENIRWIHTPTKIFSGEFQDGNVSWFLNGKLNVCDNCVDRWAEKHPDKIAIIWESDEIGVHKKVTYSELRANVCKAAQMLKRLGVRKYDTVAIYMPMIPETIYCMLACARLGAVHSVIFAGFSAVAIRDRLTDAHCKIIITADQGMRGGKVIQLKSVVDQALKECPFVTTCVVFKHLGKPIDWNPQRDHNGTDLFNGMRPYCPLETMDAEDLLFMLYTSGSTGQPKGIAHSSAGYLLYTMVTLKYIFDIQDTDIFCCVADVGWITGHSYLVYGPLANGATTIMFESVPTYPDAGRYWDLIDRYRVTQFYTAPTAIRALMRCGPEWPMKYSLETLRVLGSVGEPINPEAWRWYYEYVGRKRCSIVDTYWQTETGGHLISPLPGATRCKPGSACLPFFGIDPVLVDGQSGKEIKGNRVHGVLCIRKPWPGMMRTVYGDHERMLNVYMRPYSGLYFTGDGACRDHDGYLWITGRIDDTINVSGHRLGSAEIEHALVQHTDVSEAAVVAFPHDVKGSGIFCYVTLKEGRRVNDLDAVTKELKLEVRKDIGALATPDYILITPGLPKTRSGKIMRRILRKIACKEADSLGDVSTLADPSVVDDLVKAASALLSS